MYYPDICFQGFKRNRVYVLTGMSAMSVMQMMMLKDHVVSIGQLPSWIIWWGSGLLGVVVFVSRYPERLFLFKFDFIGNSHQFWHLFSFVSLASCVNVIMALAAFEKVCLQPLVYTFTT